MRTIPFRPYWLSALLISAAPLHAESEPWDIGLALTLTQSPFVDGSAVLGAKPVLLDKSGFNIDGPAWSFSKAPAREFYIGAGLDEWDHQRGDSAQLKDMQALDRAINLRVGGAWKLGHGVALADLAKDVAAHKGTQAKLRYTFNPAPYQAALRPFVEGQWLSADMADYYVGVNASEASSSRPAYQAGSSLALKAGLTLEHALTPAITLVGGVNVTRYDSEITNSPVIDRGSVWGGYAGLTYRW